MIIKFFSCLVSGTVEQLVGSAPLGVFALLGFAVLPEEDALDVRRRVGKAPLSLTDASERNISKSTYYKYG